MMRLTFFIIAPKQRELQSCARMQIKDKTTLFKNITSKTSKNLKDAPIAWLSSREFCWKNIWSIHTCLKVVSLSFSSTPWPKMRHLFPLRYSKLDLTIEWVIGVILRKYFSCLHYGLFAHKSHAQC